MLFFSRTQLQPPRRPSALPSTSIRGSNPRHRPSVPVDGKALERSEDSARSAVEASEATARLQMEVGQLQALTQCLSLPAVEEAEGAAREAIVRHEDRSWRRLCTSAPSAILAGRERRRGTAEASLLVEDGVQSPALSTLAPMAEEEAEATLSVSPGCAEDASPVGIVEPVELYDSSPRATVAPHERSRYGTSQQRRPWSGSFRVGERSRNPPQRSPAVEDHHGGADHAEPNDDFHRYPRPAPPTTPQTHRPTPSVAAGGPEAPRTPQPGGVGRGPGAPPRRLPFERVQGMHRWAADKELGQSHRACWHALRDCEADETDARGVLFGQEARGRMDVDRLVLEDRFYINRRPPPLTKVHESQSVVLDRNGPFATQIAMFARGWVASALRIALFHEDARAKGALAHELVQATLDDCTSSHRRRSSGDVPTPTASESRDTDSAMDGDTCHDVVSTKKEEEEAEDQEKDSSRTNPEAAAAEAAVVEAEGEDSVSEEEGRRLRVAQRLVSSVLHTTNTEDEQLGGDDVTERKSTATPGAGNSPLAARDDGGGGVLVVVADGTESEVAPSTPTGSQPEDKETLNRSIATTLREEDGGLQLPPGTDDDGDTAGMDHGSPSAPTRHEDDNTDDGSDISDFDL